MQTLASKSDEKFGMVKLTGIVTKAVSQTLSPEWADLVLEVEKKASDLSKGCLINAHVDSLKEIIENIDTVNVLKKLRAVATALALIPAANALGKA